MTGMRFSLPVAAPLLSRPLKLAAALHSRVATLARQRSTTLCRHLEQYGIKANIKEINACFICIVLAV